MNGSTVKAGSDTAMNHIKDFKQLDLIIDEYGASPTNVIAMLQRIQEEYRFLPKEIFPYMAKRLNVSEASIFSVATFYENFSLEPKGKYIIKVCDGTACHVRKSMPILERLRKELGLSEDKITTDDLSFTVQTVACLGACGLAPALTVNDKVYPSMTPEKAVELLNELKETL
jgi:NADH-quinone oxidoreductase subunit E